jgi:hypothetical protein
MKKTKVILDKRKNANVERSKFEKYVKISGCIKEMDSSRNNNSTSSFVKTSDAKMCVSRDCILFFVL